MIETNRWKRATRRLLVAALATILAPTASVAASNLLLNPGAEEGSFAGWTTGGTPSGQPLIDPSTHLPTPRNHTGLHRFGVSVGWSTADCYQYQEIPVVPGHTHEVSLWYVKEDGTDEVITVAWADGPFGSPETVLYSDAGRKPEWTELTGQTFVPSGTTATLIIRYTHAWPTNIASIHVDDVSVVDTSPPEPGALVNADFEGDFSRGIAEGWRAFRKGSGGFWKPNELLGRLGGGIYGCYAGHPDPGYDCIDEYESARMSAKTYIIDASRYDLVGRFHNWLGQEALMIGKIGPEPYAHLFPDHDTWQNNAYADGRWFADYLENNWIQTNPGFEADAYYCHNEPSVNVVSNLQKVCRFELGFTHRMHELGHRTCVLNNSVGTPAPPENFLIDEVRELLAEADYVGYHAYGNWDTGWMCPENAGPYTYRWQTIAQWYIHRRWRFPPVIYTEGGQYWWVGEKTPQQIIDDLTCYEQRERTEEFWSVGLQYFVTGAWPGAWDAMHLGLYPEIIDGCRAVNQAHPTDAHDGLHAQEFGGLNEIFDMGITQQFESQPGRMYAFSGWFRYEFEGGRPNQLTIRVGWDPTGQTDDADAPTVQWSPDLIALGPNNPIHDGPWDTDIWYEHTAEFPATGSSASIWIRGTEPTGTTSSRVYVDDIVLVTTGEPVPVPSRLETY